MSSLLPPSSSGRIRRQTVPFGKPASEAELRDADSDIDDLADEVMEDEDDFDWTLPVPGRPGPFSSTWNLVYQLRTAQAGPPPVLWTIQCAEGCGKHILMNGQFKEIDGKSTPHGGLRKPPVCHIIPWAHLKAALEEMEQKEKHGGLGRPLTDEFKKYVCWGDKNNLRPGHNECNAKGAKETAATYLGGAKTKAQNFVDACVTEMGQAAVWGPAPKVMPAVKKAF